MAETLAPRRRRKWRLWFIVPLFFVRFRVGRGTLSRDVIVVLERRLGGGIYLTVRRWTFA